MIESLWKSQAEWLVKLLFTFNSGNIAGFNELKQQFPNQLNQVSFTNITSSYILGNLQRKSKVFGRENPIDGHYGTCL